jgi:hypothetical protein
MQKPFVIFDIVLHLTSATINCLIEVRFATLMEIGYDKTKIFTLL